MQATICGSKPVHKAVLIRVQTLVLRHTCPPAAAFLIPFSQYTGLFIFISENIYLIYLTTNPQAHFVYTVHWSQTQGEEMTLPNAFGDTYTYCAPLVKCIHVCLYIDRREMSAQQ